MVSKFVSSLLKLEYRVHRGSCEQHAVRRRANERAVVLSGRYGYFRWAVDSSASMNQKGPEREANLVCANAERSNLRSWKLHLQRLSDPRLEDHRSSP